jgi:hypothetical protein
MLTSAGANGSGNERNPESPNRKTQTFEENKMVILALQGCAKSHLKMANLGMQDVVNWRAVEKEAASVFGVGQKCVNS